MIWGLYNLLFPLVFLCLLPHFLWRMIRRGGYARDFLQRVGSYGPEEAKRLEQPGRPVWIQAVSVGELGVALAFMEEYRRSDPTARFVLTTNTSTGHALALQKVRPPDVTLYFPMDLPWIVARVLRRIRPAAIVLVESELWPNLIRHARQQGVPTVLINGRISERSFRRYRHVRFLTKRLLPMVHYFCAQSVVDRGRLIALGAPPDRVEVAGSAKYDLQPTPPDAAARARNVLEKLGVQPDDLILTGGSTWDGEEEILLDLLLHLRPQYPRLFLVLVPRHAERRETVRAEIEKRGLEPVLRSRFPDEAQPLAPRPDVLLVDTTGELRGFYAVSDLVFVGKSLTQTGGQNPIEPARDGKAILVGPHMENFAAIADDFNAAGAWIQVPDAAALQAAVERLMKDPAERAALGRAARELTLRKSGALRAMVARVQAALLAPGPS